VPAQTTLLLIARSPVLKENKRDGRIEMRPEISPKTVISTTNIAPVGMVFPNRAMATFPSASRSAMIPDPMTVASREKVPAIQQSVF